RARSVVGALRFRAQPTSLTQTGGLPAPTPALGRVALLTVHLAASSPGDREGSRSHPTLAAGHLHDGTSHSSRTRVPVKHGHEESGYPTPTAIVKASGRPGSCEHFTISDAG